MPAGPAGATTSERLIALPATSVSLPGTPLPLAVSARLPSRLGPDPVLLGAPLLVLASALLPRLRQLPDTRGTVFFVSVDLYCLGHAPRGVEVRAAVAEAVAFGVLRFVAATPVCVDGSADVGFVLGDVSAA